MLAGRVMAITLKKVAKCPRALQSFSPRMLSYQPPSWLAKGFEHYDKKPGQKTEKSENAEKNASSQNNGNNNNNDNKGNAFNKSTGNKDKKSGDGNKKGNGDQNPFDPSNNSTRILLVGAALGLTSLYMVEEMQKGGREITWQDFQKTLLESGQVERIVVSNKNIARVYMRSQFSSELSAEGKGTEAFGWPADTTNNNNPSASPSDQPTSGNPQATPSPFSPFMTPRAGAPQHQPMTAPYFFQIGTIEAFERKLEEAQRSLGVSSKDFIPVVYVNETSVTQEIFRMLPTILLIGAVFYLMRGIGGAAGGGAGGPGGIFKIGKSNAKKISKEQVSVSFKDIAGCDEAKKEVMEFVQFLKDPQKFTNLGARIPKGALLCGPPGTGKTLLAKAVAGECGVPFFSISGSDFVEMFVGVGPSRVRDLFKEARENAPCIIFIDEIDAVGRQRGRGGFSGSNDERENTLNQMLVEMDGFDNTTSIVVLAGTNRPDILDSALTRPGRFDRQIFVDKPDINGRKSIFEIYLRNLKLSGDMADYANRLAALTPGFVGADIANICNEAAIIAARRDKTAVDLKDFESATDRVIGGMESPKVMSPKEKEIVAVHEAGHAIAGWYLEHTDPLLKVTIIPRSSGALGFAQYLPKELYLRSREQIMDMMCMALGGRGAEQVVIGGITTGASDDLKRVTQMAYQMVQVFGMNEKIGQLGFDNSNSNGFGNDKMYSDATAEKMDEEVRAIVSQAYERTLKLITEKQEDIKAVAKLLMEKETITNGDIAELIGKRPHGISKEYEDYVHAGSGSSGVGVTDKKAEEKKAKEGEKDDGEEGVLGPAIPSA